MSIRCGENGWDELVPLQPFRPQLMDTVPGQEASIARRGPRGPTEAYTVRYVAGSVPG
jgi:hypothetical protein